MEKKTVDYAVIGIGNMGTSHAKFLQNGDVDNARLVAICDINETKLNRIEGDVERYSDAKEMLSKCKADVVLIATPHYSHPELSIEAFKKGFNVICEKPTGVYTKQVKEMNEIAEQSGKVFSSVFCLRTRNLYKKMREIVFGGQLGDIRRINWIATKWYRTQSYYNSSTWRATWAGEGGGVLLNQAPHTLDLLYFITGLMPKRVFSKCFFGKWHNIEVEDDLMAFFEYENGATANLIITTADAPGTDRLEIVGDKGRLVLEKNKLTLTTLEMSEREFNKTFTGSFGEPKASDSIIEIEPDDKQMHVSVLQNVTDTILKKDSLYIDGKDGIYSCTMANAILLSTWLDKWIDLPFNDDLYYAELKKRIDAKKA